MKPVRNHPYADTVRRSRRPIARGASVTALTLAVATAASAVVKTPDPVSPGATDVTVLAGTEALLTVELGEVLDVGFAAPARILQAGEIRIVDTTCRAAAGLLLDCDGLGEAPLVPATETATKELLLDVEKLSTADVAVTGMKLPRDDPEPSPVRWNWWTLSCELELDDFQDCKDTCAGLGYPGSTADAVFADGCQLVCTCFNDDGVEAVTVIGIDN